jgi:Phage integrase, N-terminal SAM-like domain
MTVRLIKRSWWVDFTVSHRRYRRRSPQNSRAGAQTYEAALRQKLTGGGSLDVSANEQRPTLRQFAWKWFDDYVRPNNKHSEQLAKKKILTASLLPFFGHMPIDQIRSHDVERYKAAQVRQGVSNKTISNRLTVLNKCFATAYEWLELEGAPPKIKWPKWSLPEIDYLSPDECELLLSDGNSVISEMVLMALRTGMRQGELRGLQWSSLDWLTRSVAVRHSRDDCSGGLVAPKNGRTRHIPLDIDVCSARAPNSTGAPSLVSSRSPGTRRKGPNDRTSLPEATVETIAFSVSGQLGRRQ